MPLHAADLDVDTLLAEYRPRPVDGFVPSRIVLAKGSMTTPSRRRLAARICAAYPNAEVVELLDTAHNQVRLTQTTALGRHLEGKQTLVLAEHRSAVRQSSENDNSCPNYWHFSPYGFCPYACAYCYLAGTQGVRFSPTVKVFLNLSEMLTDVDRIVHRLGEPTAFYLGKLQDGLALDPLTGYSRVIVPFFAGHPLARLTLLTKSADVRNLLTMEHRGHALLSWTLNPPTIIEAFEQSTPTLESRLGAMEACAAAGYPVRAVVMPLIPLPGWESIYGDFLTDLLRRVRLTRITLGSICSYPQALHLTEQKLGRDNAISKQLAPRRSGAGDGRRRFPRDVRQAVYRHLVKTIRRTEIELEIGLCLEESEMSQILHSELQLGRCNCVL
jgi:spore photoproduct lyase